MKAYRLEAEVTTKWIIEVHGEDDAAVTQTAEDMDSVQIEAAGDFVESVKVEVTNTELMYPEDQEDEEVEPEPEPEQEFVDLDSLGAPEKAEAGEEEEPNGN